jgi:hypothetical protein
MADAPASQYVCCESTVCASASISYTVIGTGCPSVADSHA